MRFGDGLEHLDYGRHHRVRRIVGRDQASRITLAARGTVARGVARQQLAEEMLSV